MTRNDWLAVATAAAALTLGACAGEPEPERRFARTPAQRDGAIATNRASTAPVPTAAVARLYASGLYDPDTFEGRVWFLDDDQRGLRMVAQASGMPAGERVAIVINAPSDRLPASELGDQLAADFDESLVPWLPGEGVQEAVILGFLSAGSDGRAEVDRRVFETSMSTVLGRGISLRRFLHTEGGGIVTTPTRTLPAGSPRTPAEDAEAAGTLNFRLSNTVAIGAIEPYGVDRGQRASD